MGGCEKGEKLRSINKLGSLALHWEKLQIRGKIVTRRRYLKREHGKKVRKLKSKKRSLRNWKSKRRNDKKYSRGKKKQKENKKKSIPLDTCMLWNNWTVSHRRFIIHGLIEFVGKVSKSSNEYDYSIYRSAQMLKQTAALQCILKLTIQGKQVSKRYIPMAVRWTMLQNAIHPENSQGTF